MKTLKWKHTYKVIAKHQEVSWLNNQGKHKRKEKTSSWLPKKEKTSIFAICSYAKQCSVLISMDSGTTWMMHQGDWNKNSYYIRKK